MEILSTVPTYSLRDWAGFTLVVIFVAVFFIFLGWSCIDFKIKTKTFKTLIALVCVFIIFCTLCIIGIFSDFAGLKHKVRINDELTVLKLYENYKIVEHEKYSNVFTVLEYID